MQQLLSLTNTQHDLDRFAGADDLAGFLKGHSLDGIELMPYKSEDIGYLPASAVVGFHLGYFTSWVDFWNGNEEGVLREFGTLGEARQHYGGDTRDALVQFYRAQLDMARRLSAKYVVFHVSDVSLEEALTYRFLHSDRAVIRAAVELLDAVFAGQDCPFEFLVENQWWPGFTLTKPEITEELLAGIPCPRKGILLDTGHLMHMNRNIRSEDEGIAYIHKMLDAHPGIEARIQGMHLHQSVTGAFTDGVIASGKALTGTYFERLCQAYESVLGMDEHKPFTSPAVRGLIDRVNPAYLTHELMTTDRAMLDRYLAGQTALIR